MPIKHRRGRRLQDRGGLGAALKLAAANKRIATKMRANMSKGPMSKNGAKPASAKPASAKANPASASDAPVGGATTEQSVFTEGQISEKEQILENMKNSKNQQVDAETTESRLGKETSAHVAHENAETWDTRLTMFQKIVYIITYPLRLIVRFVGFRPYADYFAVILFILFLIGAVWFFFDLPGRAIRSGINGTMSVFEWIGNKLSWLFFGWIPRPNWTYKLRLASQVASPFKGEAVGGAPRPVAANGRCDQMQWREVGTADGMCARTTSPKPIQWVLNADAMPELSKMPPELVQQWTNSQSNKMKVNIPYKLKGMYFTPQCNDATFTDGTSAGHLLQDDGLQCKRVEKPSQPYSEKDERWRPKSESKFYQGVDAFATATTPRC